MSFLENIFKRGGVDPEPAQPFQLEDWGDVIFWRFLMAQPKIRVVFSTRRGGVSQPPYDSLNLGYHVDDVPDRVNQNRVIISSVLGIEPARITCPRQQHTATVEELADENDVGAGAFTEDPCFDPCDGLITRLKNSPILLHFADCAPVVLSGADSQGKPVLAVLHAGRRGLIEGIVENGVDAMVRTYGLAPESITAAVGPAIGACCYQVSEDIASEFESRFGSEVLVPNDEGVWLNIQSAAEAALIGKGVLPENIHVLEICTSCDENFYSFRRDGVTGRHGAIAWIE